MPLLNKLYQSKIKIINYFCQIIGVSVCVQLATFPVSMFFFHQFPTYFIITNMLAIPAAFVIIILGILTCMELIIYENGGMIAFCLEYLVNVLNQAFIAINQWPFHVIKDISISLTSVILIYGIGIGFLCFWKHRDLFWFRVSFFLICCLIGTRVFYLIDHKHQGLLQIYDIKQALVNFFL